MSYAIIYDPASRKDLREVAHFMRLDKTAHTMLQAQCELVYSRSAMSQSLALKEVKRELAHFKNAEVSFLAVLRDRQELLRSELIREPSQKGCV